jgi:hypothetical protein
MNQRSRAAEMTEAEPDPVDSSGAPGKSASAEETLGRVSNLAADAVAATNACAARTIRTDTMRAFIWIVSSVDFVAGWPPR